jgi:hypothetical protein
MPLSNLHDSYCFERAHGGTHWSDFLDGVVGDIRLLLVHFSSASLVALGSVEAPFKAQECFARIK